MKLHLLLPLLALSASLGWADGRKDTIHNVRLNDCDESGASVSAALTQLECSSVGSYDLVILEQSPAVFIVQLGRDGHTVSSEFQALNKGLPLEPGKVLEWHMEQGEPQFLLMSLSWGTEAAPLKFREYLTVNFVDEQRICTLATLGVRNRAATLQEAREMVKGRFKDLTSCPKA